MMKLSESEKFNDLDINRLARQVKQNDGRANRGIVYQDDKRYNDYQGEKWLDVRSKDKKTLIAAILDGMSDVQYHYKGKLYKDIKTEDDLMASYEANKAVVDSILNFLGKYMHGHTTVYRGFGFSSDEYRKMMHKNNIRFEHQLLKILNNRGKKFNSFSVSPFISKDFAEGGGNKAIIIAADVEPNDIAFAFTAYLLGRHGSPAELELNINNLKDLKNLRIIKDIDAECARFVKYTDTEKELQKRLDSGESMESVFKYVKKLKVFNGIIYKCGTLCGEVIVKDNKIVVPRSREIHYIKDGVFVITPMDDPTEHNILYNFNNETKSKSYEGILFYGADSDDKLIIAYNGDNKYTLLDMETCESKFKVYTKKISRLPGVTWYGQKNIWHTVEFYLVTLMNGTVSIFNNTGHCVFRRAPYVFTKIDCDSDKLMMNCLEQPGKKPRRFSIKNNLAVEEM